MLKFAAGSSATIAISLMDPNGAPLVPTALSARVVDEEGVEIIAPYSVPNTDGDLEIEITVPAASNALSQGVTARTVELTITTAQGTVIRYESYLIEARAVFTVPTSSFQTYIQAAVTADTMPNLYEWERAADPERQRALMEAFFRLTRIGYRIRKRDDLEQNVVSDYLTIDEMIPPLAWQDMTINRWNVLPQRFRTAIRRAQIIEANEILRGVRPDDKRRMGILSESIGESSMMFRVGKPLDLGISALALRELTGYVDMRVTTTRA